MANEITVFENEAFGAVRTIRIDNEPWFAAVDVCRILEIGNSRMAVERLDDDERITVSLTDGNRGNPNITFVSEPGLYVLVLGSRKPEAKAFRRWITHEVIPTIHSHGMYVSESLFEQAAKLPGILEHAIDRLIAERNRADELSEKLEAVQPKADYFDAFINPCNCTSIRDTAKELQIPERQFCKFLIAEKLMYRCPAGNLMPYNKKSNEGLFIVRDFCTKTGYFGSYTLITPAGKDAIRLMLCRG